MSIRDRIEKLCNAKEITIAELERNLGFGNGTIRRWGKTSPSIDKLALVADYFDLSVEYLIGKTPFKSEKEALQSVAVHVIKYIKENPKEIKYSYIGNIFESDLECSDKFMSYVDSVLHKYESNSNVLTDLEYFEIFNILFSAIYWDNDYSGIITLDDYVGQNFTLKINFDNVQNITLELSKSILLKYQNGSVDDEIKYSSPLKSALTKNEQMQLFKDLPLTRVESKKSSKKSKELPNQLSLEQIKINENIKEPKIETIAAHKDGEDLTEEEQQKILEYIKFIKSQRD